MSAPISRGASRNAFRRWKKAHADWAATMLPYTKETSSYDMVGQVPDRYSSLSAGAGTAAAAGIVAAARRRMG